MMMKLSICPRKTGARLISFPPIRIRISPPANSAFDLYFVPKHVANLHTQNRDHKGNDSDGGDRRNQGYLQKCEGNTNSQGINAGGNGENQHFFEMDGGAAGLGLVVEGLFEHVAADEGQENEARSSGRRQ